MNILKISQKNGLKIDEFKTHQPLLGKTMELYIDDMLVKCRECPDHAEHLQEAFEHLRAYNMKLNPSKCAFGVNTGRFLGFMVTQRGIEAYIAQLKVILESPAPASRKGVQQLTGQLAALGGSSLSLQTI